MSLCSGNMKIKTILLALSWVIVHCLPISKHSTTWRGKEKWLKGTGSREIETSFGKREKDKALCTD